MSDILFNGSLQPKKKSELQDIASALGLSDAASGLTKEGVVGLIKTHLEMNETELADVPQFAGLYPRRGNKGRRQQSALPFGREYESPSEDTTVTRNPASRSRARAGDSASPVRSTIERAQEEAEEEANTIAKTVGKSTQKVKLEAKHAIVATQMFLSSAKTLSSLTLLAEFILLVSNLSYPSVSLALPLPTPHPVTLHIPYPTSAHFTIFFRWFLPSLIIPALLGALVSFSRAPYAGGSDVDVDPLTASIIRLACVSGGNWGVGDQVLHRRWRVIGAAVSLAFGFAEAIANRGG